MKIKLSNIGKISQADINIKGITVIAGLNNTGKSTIGKSLYCVFNTLSNLRPKLDAILVNHCLNRLNITSPNEEIINQIKQIVHEKDKYISNEISLKDVIKGLYNINSNNSIIKEDEQTVVNSLLESMRVSDDSLIEYLLRQSFDEEFSNQLHNFYTDEPSFIELTIKGHVTKVDIDNNDNISSISNVVELTKEVTYIDNPFVLDDMALAGLFNHTILQRGHRANLKLNLVKEIQKDVRAIDAIQMIKNKRKLENVYSKLSVCGGSIKRASNSEIVFESNEGKKIKIKNLSSGLKVFAIIKSLLENDLIEENGTIILDEPEIHLHPQWQILLAEIIVMLHNEFGLHILLTTHSPYFLEAMDVYSNKYECTSMMNYYIARENNNRSSIELINGGIQEIYQQMLAPYQDLENARYEN